MNTILWVIAIVNTAQLGLVIWQLVDGRRNRVVINNHSEPPRVVLYSEIAKAVEAWAKDQKRTGGSL